jgi:hypothetical protein
MASASAQIRVTSESLTLRGAMMPTGTATAGGLATIITTSVIHNAVTGTSA